MSRDSHVTVVVRRETMARLAVLTDPDRGLHDVEDVVARLIDHAQQGVCRPGAWERDWLMQVFGDDFLCRLEPDPGSWTEGYPGPVFDRPASRLLARNCAPVPPFPVGGRGATCLNSTEFSLLAAAAKARLNGAGCVWSGGMISFKLAAWILGLSALATVAVLHLESKTSGSSGGASTRRM